jgi:hypothetical protein
MRDGVGGVERSNIVCIYLAVASRDSDARVLLCLSLARRELAILWYSQSKSKAKINKYNPIYEWPQILRCQGGRSKIRNKTK